jgi:hypothetical protein
MSNGDYWSLVEPIWLPLNESWDLEPREFVRRFDSIRSGSRHLYAVQWCMSEIENGGLLQFFRNTTGILAPEAAAGLEAIGLGSAAQVLREAIGFFGEPYPRDRDARIAMLPDWQRRNREAWDPFYQLNQRFEGHSGNWTEAADAFAVRVRDAEAG